MEDMVSKMASGWFLVALVALAVPSVLPTYPSHSGPGYGRKSLEGTSTTIAQAERTSTYVSNTQSHSYTTQAKADEKKYSHEAHSSSAYARGGRTGLNDGRFVSSIGHASANGGQVGLNNGQFGLSGAHASANVGHAGPNNWHSESSNAHASASVGHAGPNNWQSESSNAHASASVGHAGPNNRQSESSNNWHSESSNAHASASVGHAGPNNWQPPSAGLAANHKGETQNNGGKKADCKKRKGQSSSAQSIATVGHVGSTNWRSNLSSAQATASGVQAVPNSWNWSSSARTGKKRHCKKKKGQSSSGRGHEAGHSSNKHSTVSDQVISNGGQAGSKSWQFGSSTAQASASGGLTAFDKEKTEINVGKKADCKKNGQSSSGNGGHETGHSSNGHTASGYEIHKRRYSYSSHTSTGSTKRPHRGFEVNRREKGRSHGSSSSSSSSSSSNSSKSKSK